MRSEQLDLRHLSERKGGALGSIKRQSMSLFNGFLVLNLRSGALIFSQKFLPAFGLDLELGMSHVF